MMPLHKQEYQIDGRRYTAVANFKSNELWIHRQGGSLHFTLDEYTQFEGNMEDFIKAKAKE